MLFKKYKADEIVDVQKIGVLMFGLMGDVILRTPVIHALKELYPEASIVAFVDPIGKAVLDCNDDVSQTVVINRRKDKNKIKQNLKKISAILEVRAYQCDLLVNLYNAGLSRPIVFFSSARYKLGFCHQKYAYLYNVMNKCNADRLKDEQSLYKYMISVVEALSNKSFSLHPIFHIPQKSSQKIHNYLENLTFPLNQLYTLNLGASKEDKILSFDKYFYIVSYLYREYGYIPLVLSNPSQEYLQEEFIKDFLQKSDIPYIKLDNLSLAEVAALIDKTQFIVTPDTGLMHLAMALDSWIYTIFTYTHPIFVNPENEKFIAVYEAFDKGKLYQKQNISQQTLEKNIHLLMKRMSS